MDIGTLKERYPGATCFKFGDGPEMSAALIVLVRAGKKRATCGAVRDFRHPANPLSADPAAELEEPPVPGRRDIVLNWDDTPALVIETEHVELKRFADMDEDFALAEGENEDLAGWRRDHQVFFERNGGFDPQMLLICERFRVVEDLGG